MGESPLTAKLIDGILPRMLGTEISGSTSLFAKPVCCDILLLVGVGDGVNGLDVYRCVCDRELLPKFFRCERRWPCLGLRDGFVLIVLSLLSFVSTLFVILIAGVLQLLM